MDPVLLLAMFFFLVPLPVRSVVLLVIGEMGVKIWGLETVGGGAVLLAGVLVAHNANRAIQNAAMNAVHLSRTAAKLTPDVSVSCGCETLPSYS